MERLDVIGYETMTSDHYRTFYDLRALISTHGPLSQDTKIVWIRPVVYELPREWAWRKLPKIDLSLEDPLPHKYP